MTAPVRALVVPCSLDAVRDDRRASGNAPGYGSGCREDMCFRRCLQISLRVCLRMCTGQHVKRHACLAPVAEGANIGEPGRQQGKTRISGRIQHSLDWNRGISEGTTTGSASGYAEALYQPTPPH